jgi:hypothetical protein
VSCTGGAAHNCDPGLVFEKLGLLESAEVDELLWDCDEESRKITSFSHKL